MQLVETNAKTSVFHHPFWLEALHRTYGLTPLVYTTAEPYERIRDGLVFCPVRSWITGNRLVSLPFSDHCDLLADTDESRRHLARQITSQLSHSFQYAEIRSKEPADVVPAVDWQPDNRFLHHCISLQNSPEGIFRSFHKDCIQRKIRKAERDRLLYVSGRSEKLLDHFYSLLLRTRRRHRIPPQPFRWFQNLIACMGDRATIHAAYKQGDAVATILTLKHQHTLTYKYGCSDERWNSLGGMPFVFWNTIQEAKDNGMELLDLGRSEIDNQGLVLFKERLGAARSQLVYWRYSEYPGSVSHRSNAIHRVQRLLPQLPESMLRLPRSLLTIPGSILYKHID